MVFRVCCELEHLGGGDKESSREGMLASISVRFVGICCTRAKFAKNGSGDSQFQGPNHLILALITPDHARAWAEGAW